MNFQIALIFATLSLATISAFGIESLKCKDYPVDSIRTVRVCAETGHNSVSNFPQRENSGRPANRLAQLLYGRYAIGPTPDYQAHVIANSLQLERGNILPEPYVIRAFEEYAAQRRLRNNIYNELEQRNAVTVKQPFQEQKINALAEDVTEVKNSVENLATYLRSILDNMLVRNTNEPREENIHVNFKLDPSFEVILKQFLQIMDRNTTDKSDEQSSTKSTENTEVGFEDLDLFSLSSEEVTTETENAFDGDTTEQNEEDSIEQSSNENNPTSEDLNGWISDHFGPSVNNRNSDEEIEEIFNETSNEENSTEKSEESFETWFNTVYRRITTEATTTENNHSEENTDASKESNEDTANENNENSKSAEDSNDKNDYDGEFADPSKSTEDNKVSDYDTVFIQNIKDNTEQESNVEHLKNGDRYGYAAINAANPEELNWSDCFRLRISVKNFDDKNLRRLMSKCIVEMASRIRKNEDANTKHNVGSSAESKEITETNSNESKGSNETETPATDSDEIKESSDNWAAVTDSNSSKDSNESESSVTNTGIFSDNFEYSNADEYDWTT